jgi:hypothetical protein
VEEECKKLQALIDLETSKTSFIWQPDSNHVNIVPDMFRKSKRIREPEPEDDDDDSSEEKENAVPDNSVSPVVPPNSHMPHRIHLHKIGRKGNITPEIVVPENGVVLEVEGNQCPPSFVPYSSIVSREYSTLEDDWGLQTPEHVS